LYIHHGRRSPAVEKWLLAAIQSSPNVQSLATYEGAGVHGFFTEHDTTPDLHITAGLITAGFVRTGSDVLSLPVKSLKMRK